MKLKIGQYYLFVDFFMKEGSICFEIALLYSKSYYNFIKNSQKPILFQNAQNCCIGITLNGALCLLGKFYVNAFSDYKASG